MSLNATHQPTTRSHRPHARRLRATLVAAAIVTALGACSQAGSFNGVEVLPPSGAPALQLADASGGTFDLAAEKGNVVLLFFGYTHCPDICPTTLADWARVRQALGERADGVRFVFVSVDHDRDTPATADAYAKRFDPAFVGLAADSATLASLQTGFGVTSYREAPLASGGYTVAHSSQSFLVDRQGRLRLLYPFGATSTELVQDLERLVD